MGGEIIPVAHRIKPTKKRVLVFSACLRFRCQIAGNAERSNFSFTSPHHRIDGVRTGPCQIRPVAKRVPKYSGI
jgi:hypothetical protein